MQPEIDAQLSNFFEEATPREFARVMRGYDPHQVDEHVEIRELVDAARIYTVAAMKYLEG